MPNLLLVNCFCCMSSWHGSCLHPRLLGSAAPASAARRVRLLNGLLSCLLRSSRAQATIKVPKDAYSMDFVFT